MRPKVLLTSVIRPFGGPGEGSSVGAELFHSQITRAQGPFSLRQVIRVWGLDYIAENLQAPTVVLHYPSMDELRNELAHGSYSYVGINFVVATFHKIRQMVPVIRELAPKAKIVLGGYGTVLPDEILTPWCDAICREEGVRYMQRLLGEPDDAPIKHPHAIVPVTSIIGYQRRAVVGHVTAGLGCPNGCDFCCTSHFFRQKYVPLAETGREIYEALMATRAQAQRDGVEMTGYALIDEDFFMHPKRVREFLDAVREGGEALSIFGFGSTRGLSQFTVEEVAEMGFDLIWNAVEGERAGYRKQQGKSYADLYREMADVGVAMCTSMIIGFPYQDEVTIWREFEALMALEPSMIQCLIYFAFPGTPFHDQVIAEGRYLPEYTDKPDLRRWDGFSMPFRHPRIADPKTVERIQQAIYTEDFKRLGPSIVRLCEVWLRGWRSLRNSPNPLLRKRAEGFYYTVRQALPIVTTAITFPPSEVAKARAVALKKAVINEMGALSLHERAVDAAAPLLYLATAAARKLEVFQQPGLLRVEHRGGVPAYTADALKLHPRSLASVIEDTERHWYGAPEPPPAPHGELATTVARPLGRSLPVVS